jgi:hypothetical protein
MNATDPIAWRSIENAIHYWIVNATGIAGARVRTQRNRDSGEAKGPDPRATISVPSLIPLGESSSMLLDAIMVQRYTVIVDGAGEVGVDFYPAASLTPQRISITALEDDTAETSAAALLVALQAELPAGYTAAFEEDSDVAILVTGSADAPEFAAAPADPDMLTVATRIPRHPRLWYQSHRLVYRIEFSGAVVSAADTEESASITGASNAANAMALAKLWRVRLLDGPMRELGFEPKGFPLSEPSVPGDRSRSRAVLDVAVHGLLTGAEQTITARAFGVSTSIAA